MRRFFTTARSTTEPVDRGFQVDDIATNMLDNVPINIMFCDNDFTIRYVNPASMKTLRSIERLLPVRADAVVGSSIDIFHKAPAHQRRLLAMRSNLPHTAQFPLGDEWVDLTAAAVRDSAGQDIGVMVSWAIVTTQYRLEEQVRESSTGVATAVTEMQASIAEIAHSASASAQVATEATDGVLAANETMARLTAALGEIDRVVDFIASVADETNLLALNATIEAARAGELGRGFAVVANEVKELATETDKATENIRTSVRAVQAEASVVRDSIANVVETMGRVQEVSTAIAAAVEEQSAVMNDISVAASASLDIIGRRS
ncbi:MAG: methyl-accepting chemotaxis protein [Acidimicrobiia bacterium]